MQRYLTVGPTQVHPIVKSEFAKAFDEGIFSLSHRSSKFRDIYKFTCEQLRELLNIPDSRSIFFVSSATECMERLLQGTVENFSFHFVNGYFAERFFTTAKELGKNPTGICADYGDGFDFDNVTIGEEAEAICITQNETSTGVMFEPKIVQSLFERYPDKLLLVDSVTGLPFANFNFEKTDAVFFSVQKGFAMPAGLGVMIVSDRVIKKAFILRDKGVSIGSYNNIISLLENAKKNETTITPNVPGIYLLGKVCEAYNKESIEKIRIDTIAKSEMIYNAINKNNQTYTFVKDEKFKSHTTIAASCNTNSGIIINHLKEFGLNVSSGYKELKDTQIRIANFPVQTFEDIEKLSKHLRELSIA